MLIYPQRITVRRPLGQTDWSSGHAVPPPHETLSIVAQIVPVHGKDVELLPEGVEASEARLWLSREPVYAADRERSRGSDEAFIDGAWYVVVEANHRPRPLAHCDAVLVRRRG